ncbi:GNAT family N-acetyltransferase [Aquipuribacter sp. MA13-6]|uniref:GNAT family N-acetyltransferase n=1 Tax=unclassified Aquipuribacter TaxID=2635084 RepID=UPI003EE98631
MPADVVLTARRLWQELAGVPVRFGDGATVVASPASRFCPPGFVGLVTVGDGVLATAPDEAVAATVREHLDELGVARAADVASWSGRFRVGYALGPARLAYLTDRDFTPAAAPGPVVTTVERSGAEVVDLLASVVPDEAEESGLDGITSPAFVARGRGGRVLAASGYRAWPGGAAHLCVLTARTERGGGLGRRTASAAVAHALRAGLLPQWRARVEPSRRVARALGFVEVGDQLSLQLQTAPSLAGWSSD